jgi:hypothetical protein
LSIIVTIALVVYIIALLATLLGSFVFFDRLIRHEYHAHREAWERDGRPTGYLFSPPESTLFRSRLASGRCSGGWLFWTPPWIRSDNVARALLSRMRWCVFVWNTGLILLVLLFLIYAGATQNA